MIQNIEPHTQHCRYCGNTGWCELQGTTTDMGHTYPRGSTPCRWCTLGARIFKQFAKRPLDQQPVSNYTERDIIAAELETSRRMKPEETHRLVAQLSHRMETTPKTPWKAPPWIELRRRIEAARATDDVAHQRLQDARLLYEAELANWPDDPTQVEKELRAAYPDLADHILQPAA